jgi:curved DNA-binding protein CbpA
MPCVCAQCVQHTHTLGLAEAADSRASIRKAYHEAAKAWHPDRFENDPAQRLEAEEKFKAIQTAYSELTEHFENPAEPRIEDAAGEPFAPPARVESEPQLRFGGAPGCYAEPDFSPRALEVAWSHVREPDRALALVDLSRHGSPLGDLSQYILLSRHAIYLRDAQNLLSLLWYDDLGELRFVDQRRQGKLPLWHRLIEKISGTEQKYALEIYRSDGSLFYAIASQADDSVKKVIYNFLQQKRPQEHL